MREYMKWGYEVRLFDSVTELVETVRQRTPESSLLRPWSNPEKTGRKFASWAEVFTAAGAGWPEGVAEVERMTAVIREVELPKPKCRVRRLRWSEDGGDEVDRDRLSSGQAYWRESHRPYVEGEQVVTLVIDVNANQQVSPHDILWRGAAALAMTTLLEEAGFRVELWTVHRADNCYTDGHGHFHAVKLKDARDPLDLSGLAVAVSGWFYRSVMLRAKFLSARRLNPSLGQPYPPDRLVEELEVTNPIVISGAYSRYGAESLAREALRRFATSEPPPEPEPEAPLEQVEVAAPTPPKPETAAEQVRRLKQEERDRKRYDKLVKAWQKENREV